MFKNRAEAGKILAEKIPPVFITKRSIVIGIGLKGIPVACFFASEKNLPLDFVIAKKVPLLGKPYIAVGAVTSDGTYFFDELVLKQARLREEHLKNYFKSVVKDLQEELVRLRGSYEVPDVNDRDVIIVDDGISTGHTMLAVIKCLRRQNPSSISAVVPVSSYFGFKKVEKEANNFYALRICNESGFSVDSMYEEDSRDYEISRECLKKAKLVGLTLY